MIGYLQNKCHNDSEEKQCHYFVVVVVVVWSDGEGVNFVVVTMV